MPFERRKQKGGEAALFTGYRLARYRAASQRLNVISLQSLRPFCDLKLHCLTFSQRAEAVSANRRVMHKNVFTALTCNEAKPFGVIEPLYCTLFHNVACFLDLNLRELSKVAQRAEEAGKCFAELAEPFESERMISIPLSLEEPINILLGLEAGVFQYPPLGTPAFLIMASTFGDQQNLPGRLCQSSFAPAS
jgi:hypothetical protein